MHHWQWLCTAFRTPLPFSSGPLILFYTLHAPGMSLSLSLWWCSRSIRKTCPISLHSRWLLPSLYIAATLLNYQNILIMFYILMMSIFNSLLPSNYIEGHQWVMFWLINTNHGDNFFTAKGTGEGWAVILSAAKNLRAAEHIKAESSFIPIYPTTSQVYV